MLQAADEGVGDRLVAVEREDQGNVDVDAFIDHLLDRGQALGRRRNLDHDVGAIGTLEEVASLGDGLLRVVGGGGGNFQADVAVHVVCAVVDGPKDVGGALDVFDGERLENLLAVRDPLAHQLLHGVVVVAAAVNRLLEDGGIGGDADDRIFIEQTLEVAGDDQPAANVIVPDALSKLRYRCQSVGRHT